MLIPPAMMEQNIRYIADVEAMAIHEVTFGNVYAKMRNMISQNTLFRINQGGYSVPVTTGDTRPKHRIFCRVRCVTVTGLKFLSQW